MRPMDAAPKVSRSRRVAFTILSVVYILFWLNVAFSAASTRADRLHELAFRVLFAVALVIVPTVLQLRRPAMKVAAQQQVILAVTAHMIATFIAGYVDPVAYVLVVFAIVLGWLHPLRPLVFVPVIRVHFALIIVATLLEIPLVAFVIAHASDVDESRWEDTLVFVIGLVFSIMVATLAATGARIPAWTSAIALASFGIASALEPDASGSWAGPWGIAAIAGAAMFVAATEAAARSPGRGRRDVFPVASDDQRASPNSSA